MNTPGPSARLTSRGNKRKASFKIEVHCAKFLNYLESSWERGGIWDETLTGETKQFGAKEAGQVGLVRKTGQAFDELADHAIRDGWLPEGSTAVDFINLLSQDLRAMKAKRSDLRVKPFGSADTALSVERQIDEHEQGLGAQADELQRKGFAPLGDHGRITGDQVRRPGTKIISLGEEYVSKGMAGGKVVLKDGQTIRLDPGEELPAEGIKEPGAIDTLKGKLTEERELSTKETPEAFLLDEKNVPDMGQITPEIGKAINRQAAPIRPKREIIVLGKNILRKSGEG